MRRRLISFAAALSFVLCLAAIGMEVRSRLAWDRLNRDDLTDLGWNWRRAWTRIDSSAGRMDLSILRETRSNRAQLEYLQANSQTFYWSVRPGHNSMPTDNRVLRALGVFGHVERRPESFFIRVIVPYWLLAVVLGIGPAVVFWRARRRRLAELRLGEGLCADCGYDLRATPDRCPECGRLSRLAQSRCG